MEKKDIILKMNTLKEIADLLLSHQQLVITGHIDPDGDCVGSMLALANALKKKGKTVRMILERPLTINLESLADDWDFIYEADFVFEPEDEIVVCLDSGDLGRVPKIPQHELPVINIDHHTSNDMYGNYNYVDENAAAVGEITYLLCKELGVEIDQQIGYYIAVALIWDTGCFKHSNTNPHILRITADLIELGIDTNSIYREFLGSNPLTKVRLRGVVYSEMQLAFDGRVAWILIDQEMLKKVGATTDDAASISGDLRDIRGVEVGVSILEREPGHIQLGFRSNSYVPVNEVAQYFGGGGHKRASGAQFMGNLHEVPEKVLNKIAEYLE